MPIQNLLPMLEVLVVEENSLLEVEGSSIPSRTMELVGIIMAAATMEHDMDLQGLELVELLEQEHTATEIQVMEQTLELALLVEQVDTAVVGSAARRPLAWVLEQVLLEGQLLGLLEQWQPMVCTIDTTSTDT